MTEKINTLTSGTIGQNGFSNSNEAHQLAFKVAGRLEAIHKITEKVSDGKLVRQQKLSLLASVADILIDMGRDLNLQIQSIVNGYMDENGDITPRKDDNPFGR